MTCPKGLEFDQSSFGCNRPKPTPPPPPPELTLKECITKYRKGLFPNPSDCSKFYACSKSGPLELQCPLGLNFHPMKMVCDWPSKYCISPGAKTRDKIFKTMKGDKIVPDVVDRCPEKLAEVAFPSGGQVDLGKELTPSQTKNPPSIYWEADKNSLYTLCMMDPDAPKSKESGPGGWNHWLVGNIPGNNIRQGQTLAEYMPTCPQKGSGPHRYTYMIYKQNRQINFNQPRIPAYSLPARQGFSMRNFAKQYSLGHPIAGNYFKCNWDPSVPKTFEKLRYQPPMMSSFRLGNTGQSFHNSYSYSYSFGG
ncbi:phosphatidylethanolamine-binding protein 1-like [Sitophilus oryzae]|uniref:Phosphatidylethanolamine-binding protein 1-like n=1 Tax=Sitophilus oryzae TaxID=7048 RepID=A0A6J2YHE6_SITOR|nr:phosphatidylethanolamine-binding protein 1-like [Sitophilus oryzae]